MQVRDVMTKGVVSVKRDTPFKDVVDLLVRRDVSGAPVIDESDRLVGIVTDVTGDWDSERDIDRLMSEFDTVLEELRKGAASARS